jgi:tetratricopeptide (TPR) repeat protein
LTRLARKQKIHRLQKEIQSNPTKKRNYFRLAELYRESHQYAEAKETIFHLLRLELDSHMMTEAFLWLAELCLDQGETHEALSYWTKATSSDENSAGNPSLHELHGRILLDQHRATVLDQRDEGVLDQAIESFQNAATYDSDPRSLASTYLRLGLAYHDKNLPDLAADYLTEALATQSLETQREAECYMELGLIELWDRDNPEKAISLLRLALETSSLEPVSNWLSHCYWSLSCAFMMTSNAKDAIEAGQKAQSSGFHTS